MSDWYATGTGQIIHNVHHPSACEGRPCVMHHPSDHSMINFPTHWREDRGIMERICPHGIGHPDPDGLAYIEMAMGPKIARAEGIHGCDGCCAP
jgi:hypothetical protein